MPSINHVVETTYTPTFRTEKVAGMFDVPVTDRLTKSWDIDMPIENEPWQIGLIVGASGTGKTTISRRIFGEEAYHGGFEWTNTSLLDDFEADLSAQDITNSLSHCGFSSPPNWLLPYAVLSNGQKFRCELARCLLSTQPLIVFDEFTSVVDRNVAKVGSHAVQKAIRRDPSKQFVAVTCHYDVEEWLQPDWVYDVSTGAFKRGCLRRPDSRIQIFRCSRTAWALFKGNHYLSADLAPSAQCFIALFDGEPASFTAILPYVGRLQNAYREHRTVTLPDYQGLGIGNRLSEYVGEWLYSEGKQFRSVTSHPAMIGHRYRSRNWIMNRKPSRMNVDTASKDYKLNGARSASRLTASFTYVPEELRCR